MLSDLPFYVSILFILTTLLTGIFLLSAIKENSTRTIVLVLIIIWLIINAIMALKGFYAVTDTLPPRFALTIFPPLLIITILFIAKSGRKFIDSLSLKILTQLHVVRLFVEIILLWLFLYKYVPKLMTLEGRNFDILAGLSAPLVAYFGFTKNKLSKKFIIVWNILCLLLLLNIVINAILSAPFPFQQFGFDQPNIALLYYPFVWLPAFIVPVVLFSHLALIRRLSKM